MPKKIAEGKNWERYALKPMIGDKSLNVSVLQPAGELMFVSESPRGGHDTIIVPKSSLADVAALIDMILNPKGS